MDNDKQSPAQSGRATIAPTFLPLVTACADHGICRSVAFELARSGKLETFTIGTRRYVYLDSLRTLPERLAANDADGKGAAA